MSNLRDAFEAALAQDRYDVATRLAYSDYLMEQGEDDLAARQRYMASEEWCESARWMEERARECGQTCENYAEVWHEYIMSDRSKEAGERAKAAERWLEITYDDLVEAGYRYVKENDCFVQEGSESLRDLFASKEMSDLYWKHWSVITGEPEPPLEEDEGWGVVPRYAPFSCSC